MSNKLLVSFDIFPKVEVKGTIDAEYLVEFIDGDTNKVIHKDTIRNNMWTQVNKKWYINWIIKVNGKVEHIFNLKNKEVKITIDSKSSFALVR